MVRTRLRVPIRSALSLLAILVICAAPVGASVMPRSADSAQVLSTESMVLKAGATVDGVAIFRELDSKFKQIKDYEFESTLVTFKNGRKLAESGRFFFKSPNLVRFEVAEGSSRGGSIVVRQPDGKVKARGGGFFSHIVIGLSPDSKMLRSANGYNILKSDFSSLLVDTLKNLKSSQRCLATSSPVEYPGLGRVDLLEVLEADGLCQQRVALDTKTRLPLEWVLFTNGKILSITTFQHMQVNTSLSADLFVLDQGGIASAKALEWPLTAAVEQTDSISETELKELKNSVGALRAMAQDVCLFPHPAHVEREPEAGRSSEVFQVESKEKRDEEGKPVKQGGLSPERLLRCVASMESMVFTLKNAGERMEATGGHEISERWNATIGEIDVELEKLMSKLEESRPDEEMVRSESKKIEAGTLLLDDIIGSAIKEK